MTPKQIAERCPITNTKGILGGLWAEREGHIDPSGVVHSYAAAAVKRGAKVVEHCKVEELKQLPNGEWQLTTEKGIVRAEHIVNAAGLWAKQVGRMAGAAYLGGGIHCFLSTGAHDTTTFAEMTIVFRGNDNCQVALVIWCNFFLPTDWINSKPLSNAAAFAFLFARRYTIAPSTSFLPMMLAKVRSKTGFCFLAKRAASSVFSVRLTSMTTTYLPLNPTTSNCPSLPRICISYNTLSSRMPQMVRLSSNAWKISSSKTVPSLNAPISFSTSLQY